MEFPDNQLPPASGEMAVRDEFRPLEDLGEGLIRDQYIGNARHLSFRLRSRPGVNGHVQE